VSVAHYPKVGERWVSRRLKALNLPPSKGGAVHVLEVVDGADARATRVRFQYIASGRVDESHLVAFDRSFEFDAEPDQPAVLEVGPTSPRSHLAVVS
jgi:hypothetical protein